MYQKTDILKKGKKRGWYYLNNKYWALIEEDGFLSRVLRLMEKQQAKTVNKEGEA